MDVMASEQLAFRPATPADSAFAYEVKKAALGPYIAQAFGWDEAQQRAFHAEEYDPTITQIILFGDQQIGWLAVQRADTTLFISDMYCLPSFQGQGIGKQLLQALLTEADTARYVAKLDVLKVNPARRLYERCGFSIVGENAHFYHMERQPQPRADGAVVSA